MLGVVPMITTTLDRMELAMRPTCTLCLGQGHIHHATPGEDAERIEICPQCDGVFERSCGRVCPWADSPEASSRQLTVPMVWQPV